MKVRTRLTISFTVLVLVIITIRIFITYSSLEKYRNKDFYQRLHAKAFTTAVLLLKVQNIDSVMLRKIDQAREDVLLDENISIYDAENREIYTNNDTVFYTTSKELFDKIRAKGEIRFEEGPYQIIGTHYTDKEGNDVIIIAGAVDVRTEDLMKHLIKIYAIEYLIFIFVITGVGWFFAGKFLEPIVSIIHQANHLSPVEKSERLTARNEKDEIAALIDTFNSLFNKLEISFKHQKSFAANVSHELMNPLTKIKSQLQVSLLQARDSETYRQTIQSVLEDLNELIALMDNLLNYSKLESYYSVNFSSLRIDELLFDIRDHLLSQYSDYHIHIDFAQLPESEDSFVVKGNRDLLFIALKNIIENGCKFSDDKSVSITISVKDEAISLIIKDRGPGIPEGELQHIFETYYRSPAAKTVKGYGIGLALAQGILKVHSYPITVQSSLDSGTTFIILVSSNPAHHLG